MVSAAPAMEAPATVRGLASAILAAAKQAESGTESQGLASGSATQVIEAAILGVIARSGADPMVIYPALTLAQSMAGDPLIVRAILAASVVLPNGPGLDRKVSNCRSCTLPLSTGSGAAAGGGGSPAYSSRTPY